MISQLEVERNRLIRERTAALATGVLPGLGFISDALGLNERVAGIDGLIDAVERFMSTTVPTVEAQAAAGDTGASARLLRAANNILALVGGTSMASDLVDDIKKTVEEAADDAGGGAVKAGQVAGAVAGGALAAVAAATVADALGVKVAVRFGAALIAGLGGAWGGSTLGREAARALLLR